MARVSDGRPRQNLKTDVLVVGGGAAGLAAACTAAEYDLPRAKVFMFPTPRPNELLCNCTRIIGRDGRETHRDFEIKSGLLVGGAAEA